jgi:hypothetical protein
MRRVECWDGRAAVVAAVSALETMHDANPLEAARAVPAPSDIGS